MITVTPGFYHRHDSETVPGFPGLSGGVRIVIDDQPLTKFTAQTIADKSWRSVYSATGKKYDNPEQFVGINLELSLGALFDAFKPFVSQNADRYQEYAGKLFDEPSQMVIVFSHLDGDHIRIAALPKVFNQYTTIYPDSQIGYSITPEAFANALADCYEECLDYVRNAFIHTDRWRDFSEDVAEVEEYYADDIKMLRNIR